MGSFHGQRPPANLQEMTLGAEINHVVGTTVTRIKAPVGGGTLIMMADSGDFRVRPGDHREQTFTAATTDVVTIASHGFTSGDGPYRLSSSGTLPTGLTAGVDYWVSVIDANTFKFALSKDKAVAGDNVVDITATGSGTHTLQSEIGAMPTTALVASTVTDGTGAAYVREGSSVAIPGVTDVTVKGFNGTDTLTYWWI